MESEETPRDQLAYSPVRNRRGVAISGGVGKSLKVNKRGVAISGGVEKLQGECLWGGLSLMDVERRPTYALDKKR